MKGKTTTIERRKIMWLSLILALPLVLMLSSVVISSNAPFNLTATENVTRPDEVSQYHEIIAIKNQTNLTLPVIHLGGVDVLYGEDDTLSVYASITSRGQPTDPKNYCNITITHWNGTDVVYDFNSTAMTKLSTGWYFFNWSFLNNSPEGSYGVLVEADPGGRKTHATAGFKYGFDLNVTVTVDVADVIEKLDCDGTDDSPICGYTDGLQSSVDMIEDMLNCSDNVNNSDLCNYSRRIEENLSILTSRLFTHNNTIWDKLLTIETTLGTVNTNTDDLEEMLDCDTSSNDVCTKINNIRTLADMINVTTQDTLNNLTSLSLNVSSVEDSVRGLVDEFNCTSSNPSDVCYRLQLLQNYTNQSGPLATLLREINVTTHRTLENVSYINEARWGNFSYTKPIPTVIKLQGKIKKLTTGQYLSTGSLQVNITDTYTPTVVWSHEFNNVMEDGMFNLLLGGTYDLSLIPKRKYERDVTVCDGPTFNVTAYTCETFTTYFIA